MMSFVDTGGGASMMMQHEGGVSNSNDDHLDDEEYGDGASSLGGDGSTTDLKDRAAKETKRTLARKETRQGTLRQA